MVRTTFQEQRDDVLRTAEAVFARHGYAGASMAEIARQCGIAVGSLYKFAPSKELLYLAILESHLESFHQRVRDALASTDDPLAALTHIVEIHLAYCDEHRDFFVIYSHDRMLLEWQIRERYGERVFELHVAYLDLVASAVRRAQQAGRLRPFPAEDLAHLLVASIHTTLFQWLHGGAGSRVADKAPQVLSLFLQGAAEPGHG